MEPKAHWEKVYNTKAPDSVSWYAPHLETSLNLIWPALNVDPMSVRVLVYLDAIKDSIFV